MMKQNYPYYKDYYRAIEKGYWNGNMKYCNNITDKWLSSKKKFSKIITHKNGEIIKYKGKEYLIDNYHIKVAFKNSEEEFAKIISTFTNKRIELLPRFDYFKSPDAKIGREYIDFKITTSGTDKFIFNNIRKSENQSNNFLFWIKNNKITNDIIKYQIDDIFRRIKKITIVGYYRNKKIYIYKRK